jgi:DNA-directed RNA polymerase specialized sigma24 family protein
MDPFVEAVLPLAPALYRTARRMTHRPDEALLVTRDALARARRDRGPENLADTSRGPLFGALWQALVARWRREGRAERDPGPETPDQLLDAALAGEEAELERVLMGRLDASPDVDVALRHLAERERFVVLLVDVEGCSYEDTAAAMGSDLDTIRGLLLDGRARVFASLFDYARRTSGVHPSHR